MRSTDGRIEQTDEAPIILHVEDEDATAYLLQLAFDEIGVRPRTFPVTDGEHAIAFFGEASAI